MGKLSTLKKGDTVILHMFTGIAVGVKEITYADKSCFGFETRSGLAKFSRKTGKQVDPPAKAERFANYVTEDDGSFEASNRSAPKKAKKSKAAAAPAKKGKKKPEPEPDEEDFDEGEYEEEEEAPAPKKKKSAKKGKKKPEPEPDEDEDDDDD